MCSLTPSLDRSLAGPRMLSAGTPSDAHDSKLQADMRMSGRLCERLVREEQVYTGAIANEKTTSTERRKEAMSFELLTLSAREGDSWSVEACGTCGWERRIARKCACAAVCGQG